MCRFFVEREAVEGHGLKTSAICNSSKESIRNKG